ncbi:MAG: cytochrome c [Saprospiraceae bacterium]
MRIISFIFLFGFSLITLINCNQKPYAHGKIMYENFCVNCHMEDGSGLGGNIPPLAKADYLTTHADQLACIIRYGIEEKIIVNGKEYTTPMAGVPQLTDVEIANIINYINHEWGNDNGYTTIKQVQAQLEKCR